MKIKGLKETIIRRNGEKKEYVWEVKQISEKEFYCPQLDFSFNPETGETDKQQGIGKPNIKIGETFEYAGRKVTYELVIEEEPEEQPATQPTTLVQEWRYEDGRIEEHKVYPGGQLWEKGGHRRLYFDSYGRGAYVDLKTNTFHPDRNKAYPLGEWKKNWGATVEYRFILR
ncbi:hypothetical protein KVG29_05230 [Caldicoprobacter algeriensis]|uniref:hypothetical protein n=1 Tax=Caldicoprobacter algeriensis TaxID=699281 RepID=UPI0020797897|nr:hypothetical protein [Caldicoprobacter algeriensis]MCM8900631.1 hypothetical protein [Caldicoprobacter algeriensis]